jgi:hypothetical protein
VHVVWYDDRDGVFRVWYKRSDDGGATWSDDVPLSLPGTHAEHPSIAVSELNVHVVWHDVRDGFPRVHYRRSVDRGRSFGEDRLLAPYASGSAHASVAVDGHDVHAIWVDNREGHGEVYTRRSADDGASWSPEARLSDVPYDSYVPTIAASAGRVYAGWVDTGDGNEEEHFRASDDRGVSWGPISRLTYNGANSWAPSIAANGATVHFVWFDQQDAPIQPREAERMLGDMMIVVGLPFTPTPDGVIVTVANAAGPPQTMFYGEAIMVNVRNMMAQIAQAALQWVSRGGDPRWLEVAMKSFERAIRLAMSEWEIYYVRSDDAGRTWSVPTRLTYAPGTSLRPSIAIDGDNVHLAWFDGRGGNSQIFFKRSRDAGRSWEPDVRITQSNGEASLASIAVHEGIAHVVWSDTRGGNPAIWYRRSSPRQ